MPAMRSNVSGSSRRHRHASTRCNKFGSEMKSGQIDVVIEDGPEAWNVVANNRQPISKQGQNELIK